MTASPTVACVQSLIPAQCAPLGTPIKNITCQNSHGKLRRKEKTATFSSGMLSSLSRTFLFDSGLSINCLLRWARQR